MYNYSYQTMKKQVMNKSIYKTHAIWAVWALINSDLYQMTQIKLAHDTSLATQFLLNMLKRQDTLQM